MNKMQENYGKGKPGTREKERFGPNKTSKRVEESTKTRTAVKRHEVMTEKEANK